MGDTEKWNKLNKDEVVGELVKRDGELLRRDQALAKRDRQVDKLLQQQQKTLALLSNLVRASTGQRKYSPIKSPLVKLEANVKEEVIQLDDSDDEQVADPSEETLKNGEPSTLIINPLENVEAQLGPDQQTTSNNDTSGTFEATKNSTTDLSIHAENPSSSTDQGNEMSNVENQFSTGSTIDIQEHEVLQSDTSSNIKHGFSTPLSSLYTKQDSLDLNNTGFNASLKTIKSEKMCTSKIQDSSLERMNTKISSVTTLLTPATHTSAQNTSSVTPYITNKVNNSGQNDTKDMIKCLDCGQDFLSMYHIYQHASIVHYYTQCNVIAKTMISEEGKCSKCEVVLGNSSSHYWHVGVKHRMVLSFMTEEKQKSYLTLEMLRGFKQTTEDSTLSRGIQGDSPSSTTAPSINFDDIAETSVLPQSIVDDISSGSPSMNTALFSEQPPTISNISSVGNDKIGIDKNDKKSEYKCPDCFKHFPAVSTLFNHAAASHYHEQCNNLAKSIISQNGECVECHAILQVKQSYAAHVGAKHRKILNMMTMQKRAEYMALEKSSTKDTILLNLEHRAPSDILETTQSSTIRNVSPPNISSPFNSTSGPKRNQSSTIKCPECEKVFTSPSSIYVHAVQSHYRKPCKEFSIAMFDNGKCKLCGIAVKPVTQSLNLHYGSTHRKVLSHMSEEIRNVYVQFENEGKRKNTNTNGLQCPTQGNSIPTTELVSNSANTSSTAWRPFERHHDESSESEDDEIVKNIVANTVKKVPSKTDTHNISLEQQLEKEINDSGCLPLSSDSVEGDRYLGNQTKNVRKFNCNKCGVGFTSDQMLRVHRKAAHSFTCQHCQKSFLSKQGVQIHIKNSCKMK